MIKLLARWLQGKPCCGRIVSSRCILSALSINTSKFYFSSAESSCRHGRRGDRLRCWLLVLLLLPMLALAVLPIPIFSIPISDWPSLSGLLGARFRLPRCDERRRGHGSGPLPTLRRSCWPPAFACACCLGPETYSCCISKAVCSPYDAR